jgi:hypothetical protein
LHSRPVDAFVEPLERRIAEGAAEKETGVEAEAVLAEAGA